MDGKYKEERKVKGKGGGYKQPGSEWRIKKMRQDDNTKPRSTHSFPRTEIRNTTNIKTCINNKYKSKKKKEEKKIYHMLDDIVGRLSTV